MNRILIPIDFSENAERALAAAKIIADKKTTELIILHAYQPYIPDVSVMPGSVLPGIGSPDYSSLAGDLETSFRTQLDDYVATIAAEGYKTVAVWTVGGVQSAVEDAIEDYKPDLIVTGRTGTGGFFDKLIGSSATHIALHSPCPVMIIPPQAEPKKFSEVVYATQLEYSENDILREVFALMNRLGSRLTLLKVDAPHQPNIQPDNQFLSEIKQEFKISDDIVVYRKAKHVLDGIESYCDEIHADLLIMSTRERSFIEEFLINPSLTKKLVVDTHVPLLIYHLSE
ncbi:universal stress protein [Dyadobacter sp. LHD-138]|uniref:universal stress protein n=1 Tax=Dyadobacter sp. LHD-138 TaxID=3071413 RepID=UPI0027E02F75|nr:universal stress protein [Dyadobacter sp. LHD-138]MDQ6481659.1 universal stress protein [Dyadobacter sp. LHD-138]